MFIARTLFTALSFLKFLAALFLQLLTLNDRKRERQSRQFFQAIPYGGRYLSGFHNVCTYCLYLIRQILNKNKGNVQQAYVQVPEKEIER